MNNSVVEVGDEVRWIGTGVRIKVKHIEGDDVGYRKLYGTGPNGEDLVWPEAVVEVTMKGGEYNQTG